MDQVTSFEGVGQVERGRRLLERAEVDGERLFLVKDGALLHEENGILHVLDDVSLQKSLEFSVHLLAVQVKVLLQLVKEDLRLLVLSVADFIVDDHVYFLLQADDLEADIVQRRVALQQSGDLRENVLVLQVALVLAEEE